MRNSLVLLAVLLSVAAFAGMMRIKTDVQTMDRKRLQLVRERAELRETKRVLEAEWALLASPNRMERVVAGMGYVPATALDVVALVDPSATQPAPVQGVAGSAVAAVLAAGLVSGSELGASGSVVVTPTVAVPAVASPTAAAE